MRLMSLKDLPVDGQDVILRVDFNVPLNADGKIIDDTRLKASVPTITYLLKKQCRVILMSHLGRPKSYDPSLSLKQLIKPLENLVSVPVYFLDNLQTAKDKIKTLPSPCLCLLENLRFNSAEENPSIDPGFAKTLASLGQFYIDDAFACSHRAHSSITEIATYFPKKCAPGFLMTHEIDALSKVFNPQHPFYLLLGGSKISTKMGVMTSLTAKCDALFIGGAMAFPFIKALGISTGSTLIKEDQIEDAKKILHEAKTKNIPIHLPLDWCCQKDNTSNQDIQIFSIKQGIAHNFQAYDIGPATIKSWSLLLANAKTIFWNGPLGLYETPPFDQGTVAIAKMIASMSCDSIVGGGDSVAAIEKNDLKKGFSHLSTGGGASLEFLEKKTLPGIDSLKS